MQFVTWISLKCGGRCSSSVVECPLLVEWVIRSIPHGEPIELFLIPDILNYFSILPFMNIVELSFCFL